MGFRRGKRIPFDHPCPVCKRRGFVTPHPGSHTVAGPPPSQDKPPDPPPSGRANRR